MPSLTSDRISGLSTSVAVKAPVKVVAALNVTQSGEQTIDSVACVDGDRVLCIAQSDQVTNGIWEVRVGAWNRAPDFDGARDVRKGTLVVSNTGTTIYYRVTSADPVNVGISNVTFEEVSGSVTQASIGAALYPRTAAEIASGVVPTSYIYPPGDVRRYGATGDGSTDDTLAINNALLSNSDVYVPDGTYMIDADGTWTGATNSGATGGISMRDNQRLTLSAGAILKAITTDSPAYNIVRCYDVSNVIIEGGTIQGERSTHTGVTGEHGFAVGIWGSDNVTIRDVVLKDCWGDGLFVDHVSSTPSTNIVIDKIRCTNNRRNGASLVWANKVRVSNSTFDSQTGTAPQAGLGIEPDVTKSVFDVTVSYCDFYGNVGNGFYASKVNGVAVYNIIVDGCSSRSNANGYVFGDMSEGVLSNSNASGNITYGIVIEDSVGVTVTGCSATNNGRDGLRIQSQGDPISDILVSGSMFYSNGATTFGNGAIVAADATETYIPKRVAFQNCTFRENNLVGLSMATVADSIVSGCVFNGNSQATDNTYANLRLNKVSAVDSSRVIVSGNMFLDGGLANGPNYHIQLSAADNCLIVGNDLSDAPTTAAVLISAGSGGNVFKANAGYITSNSGTGSIASGATTAVITHGLSITPTAANIHVTFTENPTNDPGNSWVSTIGATQFTVNVRSDPGASNLDFSWSVTD
jgi:parallel beta-helix repeat protein